MLILAVLALMVSILFFFRSFTVFLDKRDSLLNRFMEFIYCNIVARIYSILFLFLFYLSFYFLNNQNRFII